MKTYKKASEVIEQNQIAVIVFTHGDFFTYDAAGNGSTGKWVVDHEDVQEVNKVIIYLQRKNEKVNRIYLGNFAGTRQSDFPNR